MSKPRLHNFLTGLTQINPVRNLLPQHKIISLERNISNGVNADFINKVPRKKKIVKLVIIMGVGNSWRRDDGFGSAVITALRKRSKVVNRSRQVFLFDVQETPENYLEKIARLQPGQVIFIDAGDFGGQPGEVRKISVRKKMAGSGSTHRLPLSLAVQYLKEQTRAKITLFAVQPQNLKWGKGLSQPVAKSRDKIVKLLLKKFNF